MVFPLLLLAGCNHRVASEKDVDVCALMLEAATSALHGAPVVERGSGTCQFHVDGEDNDGGRIQVGLLTRAAAGGSRQFDQSVRLILAEAAQTYGNAGSPAFGDLAEVAVGFGSEPSQSLRQVVVAERGVMMEVFIGAGTELSRDEVVALTRALWTQVITYKRPSA
ncbi:MAG TPA: hypothetical protein VLZ32_04580 [Rhodanobacter sp.]|nr:hypothetical protein [Rhodanobacter sp.]